MPLVSLLLAERRHLAGAITSVAVKRAVARADHTLCDPGEGAQLQRHFDVAAASLPVAALTRAIDAPATNLASAVWLRADPAWIQPDMVGARLMAYGPAVQPSAADADALAPALHEMFASAGLVFDAPVPSRWYVRLPPGAVIPQCAPPESVLGEDILPHLPAGDGGARWRQLFTQAQMILHQHPWNQRRRAEGKEAINALWFWGVGQGIPSVQTRYLQVRSRDALLLGLAHASGIARREKRNTKVDALIDLRHLRSLPQIAQEAILPLLDALANHQLRQLIIDFQDGHLYTFQLRQRWRFWRRDNNGFR